MLFTHRSIHAHRHQPQLFTHSCYILYHSPTFILTSITHSFNTFSTLNTHLTQDSFFRPFIHSCPHKHQPEPFAWSSIDIDPMSSRYRSHINIDINSVLAYSLYSFVAHPFIQHTEHPRIIHNITHINSGLINDHLSKMTGFYIINHNPYLRYPLKATSITSGIKRLLKAPIRTKNQRISGKTSIRPS